MISADLFRGLYARGIRSIQIDYAGSGDEGWMEEVRGYDAFGTTVDLTAVEEEIREAGDEIIGSTEYNGWENNDGGSGTITIDLETSKATVSHMYYETVSVDGGEEEVDLNALIEDPEEDEEVDEEIDD